jgi:hypothetical protein
MKPSKGHQTLKPSKSHQALEPSIGHRVRIFLHLFPFPFLEKANLDHLGVTFPNIIFDLNIENICSYNFPWEENND